MCFSQNLFNLSNYSLCPLVTFLFVLGKSYMHLALHVLFRFVISVLSHLGPVVQNFVSLTSSLIPLHCKDQQKNNVNVFVIFTFEILTNR